MGALSTIGGILVAVLVLLLMVTIHEAGHFLAGKKLGFKINEFAVGFGPKLLSKKRKDGTTVSLRAFPLGGFCAFEGEDAENPSPDAFNNQKPWKRVIVLAAGAVFNILSAVIFSLIALLAVGNVYKIEKIEIGEVYGAERAGITAETENPNLGKIQIGDAIIRLNDVKIVTGDDLSAALKGVPDGQKFSLTVIRGGEEKTEDGLEKWTYKYERERGGVFNCGGRTVTEEVTGKGLGVGLLSAHKPAHGLGEALTGCVPYTFKMAGEVLGALGRLFTGATGLREVGGTVTTVAMMGQAAAAGIQSLLILTPLLAVNLGVFNLLPVPALDGCRIIFCVIEWIRKKPVSRKIEGWVHAIGLLALLGFVVLADLLQIFVF